MAFSTIFITVIVIYIFVYGAMICYDLFIKKDPADLLPKVEDEEVDISDEVGQFQPILIEKDDRPNDRKKNAAAQKPTEKGDKNGVKAGTASSDGTTAAVTFDDEVSNRKSLSDTGPKEADEEEKKRIRELVALKRQELLAEQMADETETQSSKGEGERHSLSEKPKPTETDKAETPKNNENNKPKDVAKESEQPKPKRETAQAQKTRQHTTDTRHEPKPPATKPPAAKSKKNYKPPKVKIVKPEKPRPELVSFELLSVDIDDDARKTKPCGAKTAEKVHEEFNSLPLDEILKHTAGIAKLIKDRKSKRELDEAEIEAIERSKAQNRPDLVSFRGST